jgi:hypothetical protein
MLKQMIHNFRWFKQLKLMPALVMLRTVHLFHLLKLNNNNNNNNNHSSTALYGLGPPLSEVTRSLCICGSEGPAHWPRFFQLDPDVTARAIWRLE